MTTMPTLRDILNDTPANAVDVDYNFGVIEAQVGSELINRDGSIAMTQPLSLAGPAPTQPSHAVPKSYVDQQVIPIGTIWMFSAAAVPAGWAFCDGAEKSKTDPAYVALFNVIGYSYGTGSGTNFLLPNLQGRFPVGRQASDPSFDVLNDKGGSKDAILVAHGHTVANHTHDLSNHQHVARHTHGLIGTGGQSANHVHPTGSNTQFSHGQNGAVGHNAVPAGSGNTFQQLDQMNTGFALSDHTHNINIPESAVWTDQINNNTSSGAAPTTDQQGVAGAGANLPPFITLNFIIRIGI